MKQKMKSYDDVYNQSMRCHNLYNNFDNTKKGTIWLKKMWEITDFYMNNIAKQVSIDYPNDKPRKHDKEKFSYAVRSFMYDTDLKTIRSLQPFRLDGLYIIDDNGNKITPRDLWFGIDTRLFRPDDGEACGYCYYHYNAALYPVYLDGKRYRRPEWCNVSADYKDGVICNFYRQ